MHNHVCIINDVGVELGVMDDVCSRSILVSEGGKRASRIWKDVVIEKGWTHVRTIGSGNFGAVEEYDTESGCVAVKYVKLDQEGCVTPDILIELCIRDMFHPNVIGTCGVGVAMRPSDDDDETPCIAMIMDKAMMDMGTYGNKLRKEVDGKRKTKGQTIMDPDMLCVLACQAIYGLAYTHAKCIVNADIKPNNMLVGNVVENQQKHEKQTTRLFLSDYGLALRWIVDGQNIASGTRGYIAPEILLTPDGDSAMSMASDVWSCGVSLYEMATGVPLFSGGDVDKQLDEIWTMFGKPSKKEWPDLYSYPSLAQYDFFTKPTSKGRWDILRDVLSGYPGVYDVFASMVQFDPKKRPTAWQVLTQSPYFSTQLLKTMTTKKGNPCTARQYLLDRFPSIESFDPAHFLADNPITLDPKWVVTAMMREESTINGLSYQTKTRSSIVTTMENIHRNTVYQLVGILSMDSRSDVLYETLFKAFDLLNVLRANIGNLTDREKKGYLADVLYVIAKKLIDRHVAVHYVDLEKLAKGITKRCAKLERWVLKKTDCDIGGPTAYTFWKYYQFLMDSPLSKHERNTSMLILIALHTDASFINAKTPSELAAIALQLAATNPLSLPTIPSNDSIIDAKKLWDSIKNDNHRRLYQAMKHGARFQHLADLL
jgi:serine/threonine protein kinase